VPPADAIWRIFEFEITQCYSTIELLQYHMPTPQYDVFNDHDELYKIAEKDHKGLQCS